MSHRTLAICLCSSLGAVIVHSSNALVAMGHAILGFACGFLVAKLIP